MLCKHGLKANQPSTFKMKLMDIVFYQLLLSESYPLAGTPNRLHWRPPHVSGPPPGLQPLCIIHLVSICSHHIPVAFPSPRICIICCVQTAMVPLLLRCCLQTGMVCCASMLGWLLCLTGRAATWVYLVGLPCFVGIHRP